MSGSFSTIDDPLDKASSRLARPKEMCYNIYMTKDQVKKVLDRVLTWPQRRQEDAARILSEMEEQDASPYRLTDEQVAEVKRRLADPNPKFLTLEEVRERFAQRRT
jgi:hypothetical protein